MGPVPGRAGGVALLEPGSPLSPAFQGELEAARRRVAILEEANAAVHHLLQRIARLSAFSEGLERRETAEGVADLLFEEVRGILPAAMVALAAGDPAGGPLRLVRVAPASAQEGARREVEAQAAAGVTDWAAGLRRPIVVPAAHLPGSLLVVPLHSARRPVGQLFAATELAADEVKHEHLMLATVVGRQAAESLDNLRLAEDLRRQVQAALAQRVADLGLLAEAARTVSGPLDRDGVLRHLVEAVRRHLAVPMVAIGLRDAEGGFPIAAGIGLPPDTPWGAAPRLGDGGLIAAVAQQGQPLQVPDVAAEPRAAADPMVRAAAAGAFLGVPLVARGQVVGVLAVLAERPRSFAPEEVALLTGLAAQGALAIENARLFADLECRMAEQERALGRLAHSARMASVGLLAGGVAHEINNPLCIISNHLQLLGLRRNQLPAEVQKTLKIIEENVQRIASSLQGLEAYAAGRPGQRKPADIVEATNRVILLLRGHTLYRCLRLSTDFAADLPPVHLDRAAWEQVLLELITNAREAMGEGGEVRVALRRLPAGAAGEGLAGGEGVELVLEDSGPGIAPADLPRLFDPFFTTKGAQRGMGLGLRICRDIVQEHGGRLRVESQEGRGTRVVVALPAVPSPRPAAGPGATPPDGRGSAGEAPGNLEGRP